jgi:NitT/TauT family transport system substrate-binding protein
MISLYLLIQKSWSRFFLILLVTLAFPLISTGASRKSNTLKIAMLPIIDSFPYYIAQAEGEFKKAGVDLKLIRVMSGLNRDQLMQAGEVDGMLNEMTSAANFNRKKTQVQVVYTIRSAQNSYPMFRLIASPGSRIKTVAGIQGASIGISRHTVIEYVTDRLLEAKGIDLGTVVKKSIPAIPERFQLLMQRQIDAAMLPDPLASAALGAGATLIIDDAAYPQYSASLFTFSIDAIRNKPESMKRFFKAWDRAVARLNANPEAYRALMLKHIRIPKNVRNSYRIPEFSRNAVPSKEQWDDVMRWMVSGKLLTQLLPYRQSVTTSFLPGMN